MEKLKRYNQFILAIGGTIALVGVIIFALVAGYELCNNLWGRADDQADTRMIANDEVERLKADSLRKQVISFNQIVLVDTPGLKFLIPVGQATLERAESLTNSYDIKRSFRNYEDRDYAGTNNNLLLYDGMTGAVHKIFNKRLSINSYSVEFRKTPNPVVFMDVTDDDSNRDGFLDYRDMEKLCYFRFREKTLQEVAAPGMRFLRLDFHKSPDEILVQYGMDKDADGEFEESFEPKVFYRLRLADGHLSEVVSQEMVASLQQQLDGN